MKSLIGSPNVTGLKVDKRLTAYFFVDVVGEPNSKNNTGAYRTKTDFVKLFRVIESHGGIL